MDKIIEIVIKFCLIIFMIVLPPSIFVIASPYILSVDTSNPDLFLSPEILTALLVILWVADYVGTFFLLIKWWREFSQD
jgi:hypothetical protein